MDRRLQKVYDILKEMMVANAPGASGGFSDTSDPKGPVAGRNIYLGKGSRKRWLDHVRKTRST
jgi:hypothetical protein